MSSLRLPSWRWRAAVLLSLVVGGAAAAQAPRPVATPTPIVATAPPAPTPVQLAVSIAGLRKQVRLQAAELRNTRARLERTSIEAARLRGAFNELRKEVSWIDSVLPPLIGGILILGVLTLVTLAAAFRTAARLGEWESDSESEPNAPVTVRRGVREMEERLRRLEEPCEQPR